MPFSTMKHNGDLPSHCKWAKWCQPFPILNWGACLRATDELLLLCWLSSHSLVTTGHSYLVPRSVYDWFISYCAWSQRASKLDLLHDGLLISHFLPSTISVYRHVVIVTHKEHDENSVVMLSLFEDLKEMFVTKFNHEANDEIENEENCRLPIIYLRSKVATTWKPATRLLKMAVEFVDFCENERCSSFVFLSSQFLILPFWKRLKQLLSSITGNDFLCQ